MKKILSITSFLLLAGWCSGQLVNQGGTITIQDGAKLFVESNVENNSVGASTGMIIVKGELEVQGNFTNNATLTTDPGSLITFSGDANSDFTSGGAVVRNMKMNKDHATNGTVTLIDNLSISDTLDFAPASASNINHLVLGANDLTLTQQSTKILNPTAADYIVADAAGMVQKNVDADGTFTFPVGDASDYSPIDVDYASGTDMYDASANIRVNVDDVVHPNKPADADDYIERYWNVDQTGIDTYSADLTGTYVAGDVMGTAGDVMGASQDGTIGGTAIADWTFAGSANAADQVQGSVTTASTDFTGLNFFGRANLKVFLQGAYAGGTMSVNLPTLASFPTTTPYAVAPWNAPSVTTSGVPANTTDWILVEARDATTPSAILSQTSAFLLNDGTIVDKDGNPLYLKDADPTSIISIRHRNHLGVRTNAGVDLTLAAPSTFDFSQDTALYNNGAISNTKMVQVGADWTMWTGDVNGDGKVRVTPLVFPPPGVPSDRTVILNNALGGNPNSTFNGYSNSDVNFDGKVRITPLVFPPPGIASDATVILNNVLGGNPNTTISQHN